MQTKQCKHNWDVLTHVWTKDGFRAIPCKKCPELMPIGTVSIRRKDS